MSTRKETVYLLGAGATRGGLEAAASVPSPLDLDFFDIVDLLTEPGTLKLAKTVLKDVWSLYRRTSGISLERYYRDIETRERLNKFAKSANKPTDWGRRRADLIELIRRAIIHTTCDIKKSPAIPRISAAHQDILKSLNKGDTIITFNYDTVIEESFGFTNLWSPKDGYGARVHNVNNSWCKQWIKKWGGSKGHSAVLLLKLHGSINWTLYNNRQIRIKPRPYVLRTRGGAAVVEKTSIVPPSMDKPIHRSPYKQLWRKARLKLDACQDIVVIGYSLPEADLMARALIDEVCRLRETRKKYIANFHIVDPNKAMQDKMIEIFRRAFGPYSHVYRYDTIQQFSRRHVV